MLGQIVCTLHRQQAEKLFPAQLGQGAADARLCSGNIPVVPANQLLCLPGGGPVKAQTHENLRRHVGAALVMVPEMSLSVCPKGKGLRLSHIMQQHHPAQQRLRRGSSNAAANVLIHRVAVVPVPLVKAHTGSKLRQKHPQHLRPPQQNG